ncbi:glycosyltransferase family 2 protein [Alkalibacterium kapii]|uniref:Glycosyl hydrolase n=1 Tax=Alkalibacterium kapii TaxID=426704 RepID=A0A511AWC5_9LACT|nr:glycosyltransferase family 2 protein [Alkalibacterium kapii]GEK91421.1 glycosyl hydrolase [Alkalibacterium kapii]
MKTISIVIPIYNEAEVLPQLIRRLDDMSKTLSDYNFEFLFINDGSVDMSLERIKDLCKKDARVAYVDLSRNFGKEVAMLAGFDHAKGDAVIVIDGDLQQPPEMISQMVKWWEEGYDDVYAVRLDNEGEGTVKKWFSDMYYKIVQKMTSEKIYPAAGDFRLLDKKCVNALRELRESARYTKGMYGWIGFKKKELTYIADKRAAGTTKWKFTKLFTLAMDGITSYSTIPLKIWSYIGFIISFFSFLFLIIEVAKTLLWGTDAAGYPTLLAGILFLGGIQLISLGVIGEYLGRVFIETKNRPPYFVKEKSKHSGQHSIDKHSEVH